MEITQVERWRRSPGTRDEEWLAGKTGATLEHIRSLVLWLSLPRVVQSRVDADEVTGRHADAIVGNLHWS